MFTDHLKIGVLLSTLHLRNKASVSKESPEVAGGELTRKKSTFNMMARINWVHCEVWVCLYSHVKEAC